MTRSVLTVDDSASIRETIAFTLEAEGFEVVGAADGSEGLSQVQNRRFDLVITDLNMPVMNGFDFIRGARATPNGAGVPIVMLTTESKPEAKAEGKAAGATGWINKPFDGEKLVTIVKKLVG
ncbi:response regulator [Jannaschia formosa]|uniref:response regulator n=1 Tax=Jannaschia formosa TaxID=2259592 RepID=UPI000E1BB008|nr:response regulator [Jannaschia formosa]TFL17925.1 response regulator [Jannaschia formosa]